MSVTIFNGEEILHLANFDVDELTSYHIKTCTGRYCCVSSLFCGLPLVCCPFLACFYPCLKSRLRRGAERSEVYVTKTSVCIINYTTFTNHRKTRIIPLSDIADVCILPRVDYTCESCESCDRLASTHERVVIRKVGTYKNDEGNMYGDDIEIHFLEHPNALVHVIKCELTKAPTSHKYKSLER